jgi:hypothetical protein
MFFTLKSSILVISGYLRTVQVAPGHPVMPCESLGKSLQTCLSQDKSGFPDVGLVERHPSQKTAYPHPSYKPSEDGLQTPSKYMFHKNPVLIQALLFGQTKRSQSTFLHALEN